MTNEDVKLLDNISESFYNLLKGKMIPAEISIPVDYPENEIRQVIGYINEFFSLYKDFAVNIAKISRGELDINTNKSSMDINQSLKNLHSNLKHLTWKTQRIADGDFNQSIDFMFNFSQAFNTMTQQLKEAFEKIESQNDELKKKNEIISIEKEKSEKLLLNILPYEIVDDLKKYGKTEPQIYENVTVFFSDIAGFTSASSEIDPKVLINELNDIFTVFDDIVIKHNCQRIKTIGDAFLAVCGMPAPNTSHAENIVSASREILDYLKKRQNKEFQWKVRIGVNSGKVVGGVVGVRKYIYDIFGDTVNIASRMESNGEVMRVNVSETTYELTKNSFSFIDRGEIEVKGKGKMKMYFLQE